MSSKDDDVESLADELAGMDITAQQHRMYLFGQDAIRDIMDDNKLDEASRRDKIRAVIDKIGNEEVEDSSSDEEEVDDDRQTLSSSGYIRRALLANRRLFEDKEIVYGKVTDAATKLAEDDGTGISTKNKKKFRQAIDDAVAAIVDEDMNNAMMKALEGDLGERHRENPNMGTVYKIKAKARQLARSKRVRDRLEEMDDFEGYLSRAMQGRRRRVRFDDQDYIDVEEALQQVAAIEKFKDYVRGVDASADDILRRYSNDTGDALPMSREELKDLIQLLRDSESSEVQEQQQEEEEEEEEEEEQTKERKVNSKDRAKVQGWLRDFVRDEKNERRERDDESDDDSSDSDDGSWSGDGIEDFKDHVRERLQEEYIRGNPDASVQDLSKGYGGEVPMSNKKLKDFVKSLRKEVGEWDVLLDKRYDRIESTNLVARLEGLRAELIKVEKARDEGTLTAEIENDALDLLKEAYHPDRGFADKEDVDYYADELEPVGYKKTEGGAIWKVVSIDKNGTRKWQTVGNDDESEEEEEEQDAIDKFEEYVQGVFDDDKDATADDILRDYTEHTGNELPQISKKDIKDVIQTLREDDEKDEVVEDTFVVDDEPRGDDESSSSSSSSSSDDESSSSSSSDSDGDSSDDDEAVSARTPSPKATKCKSQKKAQCGAPRCAWVRGKGCKDAADDAVVPTTRTESPKATKCKSQKKAQCGAPRCAWVRGKGCKDAADDAVSTESPDPHDAVPDRAVHREALIAFVKRAEDDGYRRDKVLRTIVTEDGVYDPHTDEIEDLDTPLANFLIDEIGKLLLQ